MGTTIISKLVGWAATKAAGFPDLGITFSGPLTGPRTVPGPASVRPAADGRRVIGSSPSPVPPTLEWGLGAASPVPPALAPPNQPGPVVRDPHIPIVPNWDRPEGAGRLVAYDCLFDDIPEHWCVTRDGTPTRAGGSCHASAQLMARKGFEAEFPGLYMKAVLIGAIDPEEQVV